MATVEYGNWIINVDLDKTKNYYANYPFIEKTQIYKNYKKYCKTMPGEEKNFFDSFGIDPLCCKLETLGITKEKTVPVSTYFYAAGKYIKCHKEEVISVEELAENNFIDEREDSYVNVGLFQFDFENPDAVFNNIPKDIPNGFICIRVWIEAMPWLLDEKCETKMYYPPKWWQILKRIKEAKQSKLLQMEYINEISSELEADFANNKIQYEQLSKQETKHLIKKWIEKFIPYIEKNKIKEFNIYGTGKEKYNNYLWHAFSYDILTTESADNSPLCYSAVHKKKCFVLLNNEQIAYVIEDAANLDVSIINKYKDILIFDSNFTWTYCHTHEEDCGPYFYQKKTSVNKKG